MGRDTRYILFIVLLLATGSEHAYAQVDSILTLAGTGVKGFAADDGQPAVCVPLDFPEGTALDSKGNVYFTTDHRVRKIDVVTGLISTVMGNLTINYTGDGGPAALATAGQPFGICLDAAGNIYFSDVNTHTVRKITAATGIITTIAGSNVLGYSGDNGPGNQATLDRPGAVAVDSKGNVYISDGDNSRIRKVDQTTGIITTFAGNGSPISSGDGRLAIYASTPFPEGIAVDKNDNVYFIELQIPNTSRLRRIDAITGIITTVAGNNNSVEGGDGGPASLATLENPGGLCIDNQGNIYISETQRGSIRKIDAVTGIIKSIIWGYNPAYPDFGVGLNFAFGLAVDAVGSLYIADALNHRVRKLYSGTGPPYSGTAITISGSSSVCAGTTPAFTATAVNDGPNPVYQWVKNSVPVGSNNAVYDGPTPVDGDTISCEITAYEFSCNGPPDIGSNKLVVHIGPPITPTVSITADLAQLCTGSVVTFTPAPAGGGDTPTYQWLVNGSPAATGPTYKDSNPANGDQVSCRMTPDPSTPCLQTPTALSNILDLTVSSNEAPAVSIAGPAGICQGQPLTIRANATNAGAASVYQWTLNGTATTGGPTYTDDNPQTGDRISCRLLPTETVCPVPGGVLSDTLSPTVDSVPVITFDPASIATGPGTRVQLNALLSGPGIQSFQWSPASALVDPASLTPETQPITQSITFTLKAITAKGCASSGAIPVKLLGKMGLPSAFTPNGDGRNDVFRIPPGTWFELKEMDVYDRWGTKVFSSRDSNVGWDGTFNGRPSPPGVYVYVITGTGGATSVQLHGTVMLVR